MRLNNYIELRRGDRSSIREMFDACRRTLAAGNSIMMFPEGTRSPDGRLRAFKTGAFDLALETGCPILPIVLDGTANALPKRGFVLHGSHRIRVTILDEIPPESFARETVEDLTRRVRDRIAAQLGPEANAA
jgi:1-acyl-sn-glycerol-3-phosphate acyltransferase